MRCGSARVVRQTGMTQSPSTQRIRQAAVMNGLLIFGVPTSLMLVALSSTSQTWPAEVTASRVLLESLQFGLTFAALGAVAGWRTWVHARRYVAGQSRGLQGVGEAAACGLVVAILYLLPGIVARPREAPPYVIVYGGAAAILGGIVGVVLYVVARVVLRLSRSTAA